MSDSNLHSSLALNCNIIDQVTVCKLLDDRYFFIPSYQRGYRWTKKQIYDLCNDLLEYCLKKDKKEGSFYSLQPLIVRKGKYCINGKDEDAYEVIDGQQRLTTIFILYRFLANIKGNGSWETIYRMFRNRKLYHIYYETRPEDFATIEKSGFTPFLQKDIRDIDIAHISNAYQYMDAWLYGDPENDNECAEATFSLHSKEEFAADTVVDSLFKLLDNRNTSGSVQFIWYELSEGKDAIKEFLSENKGKILLTDEEKIKGLFLQRSNFSTDVKNLKQLSIAKDWELIENTLHRNDFWAFISHDFDLEDGRINIIFDYIYDRRNAGKVTVKEGDYLFRYFYQEFAQFKKQGSSAHLAHKVDALWNEVMDCFRMLQNWYYNPMVYNLIGLLIKHGHTIQKISEIYEKESVLTTEDFIQELNKEIKREIIDHINIKTSNEDLEIADDEEYVNLFFPVDKPQIHDLLRFLNVREINKTIDQALKDIDKDDADKKRSDIKRSSRDVLSHIYRFPFEALEVFQWDIEHVDSATTNSLTEPKEQEAWINEAKTALGEVLTNDSIFKGLSEAYSDATNTDRNNTLKQMVLRVREIIKEDESETRKNWVGNLTLLDSGTNRSYKNKIFAWKGNIIRDRIKAGVFVPICTQNIFNKGYTGCGPDKLSWSWKDKKAYHAYILQEIKDFKNAYGDHDDECTQE